METAIESGDKSVSEPTQGDQQTRVLKNMPRFLVTRSRSVSRRETTQSASDAWRAVERMAKGLGKKSGVSREQQSLRSLRGERDEVILPEALAFLHGGNAPTTKTIIRLIFTYLSVDGRSWIIPDLSAPHFIHRFNPTPSSSRRDNV